jgi:hypothetical protein
MFCRRFEAQRVSDTGMSESHGLPRFSIVGTELLWSGRERTIAKTTAPRFHEGWIRREAEFGIFANPLATGAGKCRPYPGQD